jgi:hypothetical protein
MNTNGLSNPQAVSMPPKAPVQNETMVERERTITYKLMESIAVVDRIISDAYPSNIESLKEPAISNFVENQEVNIMLMDSLMSKLLEYEKEFKG